MSRIGKEPVAIPAGVTVTVDGQKVTVKGKLGELSYVMHDGVAAKVEGEKVLIWSDNAIDAYSENIKHETYQVKTVTPAGAESRATLENAPGENGLEYVNGVNEY